MRPIAEVGSSASSYEILAKLATGGMAEIFLARGASAAGVERHVVLKRVLKERATDANFVRMFLDEARLAAQLQHPNIAQVYDIGKLGDSYFFTMEYVHGETVRALLHRAHALRRQIPIAAVLTLAAGAAAGLHHAHDRIGVDGRALGIVHRDVSPSNLMVSYEGTVKVVDFGVAKAAHRSQETRSGTVKGKIAYLSPEQCLGREIDRRSDLFSLGIVLWEMLTTERLFRFASDFESMSAIVAEPIAPPSSRRPEIPPQLDALVMRLLAKSPDDRFQNADDVHEAIEAIAVQTGSALSASSLGRFVRELFGQRPEPWVELKSQETHAELVTVTTGPLPDNLNLPENDIDRQLNKVPDLGGSVSTPVGSMRRPPSEALPTMPLPLPLPAPALTVPMRSAAPPTATMALVESSSGELVVDPRRTGAPSVPPGYVVAPIDPQRSGSVSSPYPMLVTPPAPVPIRSRGSRIAVIVAPAIAVGVIVGIVLAIRGDDRHAPAAAADANVVEIAQVIEDAAAVVPQQQQAVVADAALAVAPKVADAAVAVAPVVADAAVAVAHPAPHHPPPRVVPEKDKPADKPADKPPEKPDKPKPDDLLVTYRAEKFADVVAACGAAAVLSQNATVCALAACHTHEIAKARHWANLPGTKHQSIATACQGMGVTLDPKPEAKPEPNDDCKRGDPMACQH